MSIPEEILISIINDAITAPSGENAQPWKFAIEGNSIHVYNLPGRAHIAYNYKEKSSFFTHGTLLEIISISASHYGCKVETKLFPDINNPNFVALVTLEKSDILEDELYPYIHSRCTNRNEYTGVPITNEEEVELLSSLQQYTALGSCSFVNDQKAVALLAKKITVNERAVFENKSVHNFFYHRVLWNKKDQEKRSGIYVKTLETSSFKIFMMKLLKDWQFFSILNMFFRVSTIISKLYEAKYARSGTFGLITVPGTTNLDHINAGRITQRVWLTATKLGLALQPCTGFLYCKEAIESNKNNGFSEKHTEMIMDASASVATIFKTEDTMLMLFRIGHAEKPLEVAKRIRPEITFIR